MAKWIIKQKTYNMEQGRFGVPASVIEIIKSRGVSESELADYLSDKPQVTFDPFLLKDMKEVCETIIRFAREGKRICIYGDYDADGITSTALLYSAIGYLTQNVHYYVPSRFTDGYGLNNAAIQRIREDGTDLMISVDCGSTSPAEVDFAKSLGMEVIITDHHSLRDGQSPDSLFINPKRPDSEYPFRDLSGCGVAFKIVQGLQRMLNAEGDYSITKAKMNNLLDLVAISTVADVVPLISENRNLVKYGLNRINMRTRLGLNCLLERLDISDKIINSLNIAFVIAPNLNALGRIDTAALGVELLSEAMDKNRLEELAAITIKTNQKRKNIQETTARICEEALSKGDCGEYAPVIYAYEAHEGVAGIVAGNIKERLHKPVCIVTPAEDGTLKGTGRSTTGLNLHELFENCGDVFVRFGGHAGACGFSLKAECLDEFRARMQELVKAKQEESPELAEETLYIEKELNESEKNLQFAYSLQRLEPFGEGNPVPVFCIKNARVSNFFTMGSEGRHMRFNATAADGITVNCVLFGRAEEYEGIVRDGAIVNVAGELEINEFRGEKKLQMRIRDIKRCQNDQHE